MQNSTHPTIYEKIDHIKGEIRLLKIQPSTDHEATICCDLFRHNLESGTDYTALSYCWGPLEPAQIITLQGQDFLITPNLHAAMKQLRSTDTVKIMWIDALCIDQSNNVERGHQVGQMGGIYENAAVTVMWLGKETENCDLVPKLFDSMFLRIENVREDSDKLGLTIFLTSEVYEPHWAALNALLSVEYWKRAWIVQEVVLSKYLIVLCGSIEIPWIKLPIILLYINGFGKFDGTGGLEYQRNASQSKYLMSNVQELQSMREAREHGHAPTIVQGLFTLGLRSAKDHRDHIYSSLGIILDSYGIVPNYEMCTECVYIDTVERIITEDKSLDVLSLCKGFSESKRDMILSLQKEMGDHVNWVKSNRRSITSPAPWHAASDNEDKGNDNDGCNGWPESVKCLCDIQAEDMEDSGILGVSLFHAQGIYLGAKSWVPNWSGRVSGTNYLSQKMQYKLLYQAEQCHFRASGAYEPTFQISTTKEHLTVSGFVFDQVTYTTGMDGPEDKEARSAQNARSAFILTEIWTKVKQRGTGSHFYGSGHDSLMDALLRSLAAGRGITGDKLTSINFHELVRSMRGTGGNVDDEYSVYYGPSKPYFEQLFMRNWLSDMIMTSKGAVGSAEMEVREGDLVCVLFGAKIPFILRPHKDKYFLIGEAYIDGIMEGELMNDFEEGKYEKMDFCLL